MLRVPPCYRLLAIVGALYRVQGEAETGQVRVRVDVPRHLLACLLRGLSQLLVGKATTSYPCVGGRISRLRPAKHLKVGLGNRCESDRRPPALGLLVHEAKRVETRFALHGFVRAQENRSTTGLGWSLPLHGKRFYWNCVQDAEQVRPVRPSETLYSSKRETSGPGGHDSPEEHEVSDDACSEGIFTITDAAGPETGCIPEHCVDVHTR
mmetsp:Transcript_62554/g.136780  ORF Transcript_62554/g.136780 Transcript_62554/m.136780 type:complete len:209 (+) Transcript_62554:662-1288(+)